MVGSDVGSLFTMVLVRAVLDYTEELFSAEVSAVLTTKYFK